MKWLKKLWLKIWNKIRGLFIAKRKIEIEDTINKWFKDIHYRLDRTNSDSAIVDSFCRSVSSVLKTYCDATILSLDGNLKLPAMACLRVMSELVVKFIWCLNVRENKEIQERIERWEKRGVNERRKFIKELLESEDSFDSKTTLNEELSRLVEYLKNTVTDDMPNVSGKYGLFEQTKNIFDKNICPQAYRQFNPAVHVDTLVLTWSTKRKGDSIYFTGDLDENINSLKIHCLSFSYMLIKVIYVHYNWNFDLIEKEYQDAISHYTNKD